MMVSSKLFMITCCALLFSTLITVEASYANVRRDSYSGLKVRQAAPAAQAPLAFPWSLVAKEVPAFEPILRKLYPPGGSGATPTPASKRSYDDTQSDEGGSKDTPDGYTPKAAVKVATGLGSDLFGLHKLLGPNYEKEVIAYVMNFIKSFLSIPDAMFGGGDGSSKSDDSKSDGSDKKSHKKHSSGGHKKASSAHTSSEEGQGDDSDQDQEVKVMLQKLGDGQ